MNLGAIGSPAMLARPLSEILADAAEAAGLRERVAALLAELEESNATIAALLSELAEEQERRNRVENLLFKRQRTSLSEDASVFALAHGLPFLGLSDLGRVAPACVESYLASDSDVIWQGLIPRYVEPAKLSICFNSKAALLSHLAARQYRAKVDELTDEGRAKISELRQELELLEQSSLRIGTWTITEPRLQIARASGKSIWSRDFKVGAASVCSFCFHPGSKGKKKQTSCSFFFRMPSGTTLKARVFIGERSAWNFEHVFVGDKAMGSENVGPPLEASRDSLLIMVFFDMVCVDGEWAFAEHIVTRKRD